MVDAASLLNHVAHVPAPLAILDADAFAANTASLRQRAGGIPVRLATKSIRTRRLIERLLAEPGFSGVMSYSAAEAVWLADHGIDDILVGYPTADVHAVAAIGAAEHRRRAITLMVDDQGGVERLETALRPGHPPLRVCIDVDASLRLGPAHLGVRRSPIRRPREAGRLAATLAAHPGFDLVGVMFYEGQIAGLPDSSPAVRWVKRRSADELATRRSAVVAAVAAHADLEFVNGGGTGSLEITAADPAVTELTAGSGFFSPTLFDGYDAFRHQPAAFFALDVVRRPARSIATCGGGGYIASGEASSTRLPRPVWPRRLSLLGTEGAGEAQTPVTGRDARKLRIGDRVMFRHAKAGELCERFDEFAVVGADTDGAVRHLETVPTYRGEGRNSG